MFEDLNNNEKFLLDLYKKADTDNDYFYGEFNQDKEIYDKDSYILKSLCEKGYINAQITEGLYNGFSIVIDYKVNGHMLSNYANSCYNSKLKD